MNNKELYELLATVSTRVLSVSNGSESRTAYRLIETIAKALQMSMQDATRQYIIVEVVRLNAELDKVLLQSAR